MRRRQPVVGVALVAQGCDVTLLSTIRSADMPLMRRSVRRSAAMLGEGWTMF
jgi:hypothetical protein